MRARWTVEHLDTMLLDRPSMCPCCYQTSRCARTPLEGPRVYLQAEVPAHGPQAPSSPAARSAPRTSRPSAARRRPRASCASKRTPLGEITRPFRSWARPPRITGPNVGLQSGWPIPCPELGPADSQRRASLAGISTDEASRSLTPTSKPRRTGPKVARLLASACERVTWRPARSSGVCYA